MLLELAKIRDEIEIVGDVRGKGLMIGVEMVTDKVTVTVSNFKGGGGRSNGEVEPEFY